MPESHQPLNDVAVIMGSLSDKPVMDEAIEILKKFGTEYTVDIVSAHRTPEKMLDFAKTARDRGAKVIIAGAGGAAHLPGMVAAASTLPVIGVPIQSSNSLQGWDSLLSIVQMPSGVPVATMAVNGAKNAGILALQILSLQSETLATKLTEFKKELKKKVEDQSKQV